MNHTIKVQQDRLFLGDDFAVSFQRTLRLPDDGRSYPLPPGLGPLPVLRVADYADRVPPEWRQRGGVFIPLHQREAFWLGFHCPPGRPRAVKVGVGGINAVSGTGWDEALHAAPQDYLVCPDQPWLDGINAGDGTIRQFVAVPLGQGYSVEGQLTGKETVGGLQILALAPRPGWVPPGPAPGQAPGTFGPSMAAAGAMGVGAGGRMAQKVYPDPYGLDVWDPRSGVGVFVHVLNSAQYRAVTGREPPPTPIDAATYTRFGLPWFSLYDESHAALPPSERLAGVKSVRELDAARGAAAGAEEPSLDLDEGQVRKLTPPTPRPPVERDAPDERGRD
jgi:hypothetical protein